MLNDHTSVGIAEIVLYVPISALAFYLAFIRHERPRMPWWFLFMFANFRVASGILSILYQRNPSDVGLIIGAIITLNVGVIPLLLCTIGFIRLIAMIDNNQDSKKLLKAATIVRLVFFIGIALLIAGGVLAGQYTHPDLVHTGSTLTKAGYILITCTLGLVFAFEAYLWNRHRLSPMSRSSLICLVAITAAMPFQIVRITYALLALFETSSGRWSVLNGELGAFVGLVLVMEYIVVIMYVTTGFLIEPVRKRNWIGSSDEEVARRAINKNMNSDESRVQRIIAL